MATNPRIVIIDTYYPEVIKALPADPALNYEDNLQKILSFSFATGDFYSRNLRALGWDARDLIVNHEGLNRLWQRDKDTNADPLAAEIGFADVVFMQDLSVALPCRPGFLAAQLSCPWPGDAAVKQCDVIFSSFPHYIPRIEALGVRAVYNPLAFEPSVLGPFVDPVSSKYLFHRRPHDVVFIGGVGNPSHWRYGMEVLETVAREIPTFKWWGYGYDTLSADSALRRCYQGEAWGLQMYEILLQSKICLNRHGEVAEGYANNMRMFEATGCGAMLLTEDAKNLSDLFEYHEAATYHSAAQAVEKINHYLRYPEFRDVIAANGQQRTLRDHTYAQRMKTVSETLKGMLCPA